MEKKQKFQDEIARVAYEIYEQRGTDGRELEDWLEAELIVRERLVAREPPDAAKKVAASKKKGGGANKKIS